MQHIPVLYHIVREIKFAAHMMNIFSEPIPVSVT